MPGIATPEGLECQSQALCSRPRFQGAFQVWARGDVEAGKPGLQTPVKPVGQALLLTEIDNVQGTLGGECLDAPVDGTLPIGNHRKGLGDHHPI